MKDGFYWAKWKDDSVWHEIVKVRSDHVFLSGDEDAFDLDYFEEIAEFISEEPLEVPR